MVETWSDEEVATRIWYLFPKRKDADKNACEPTERELNMLQASKKLLAEYRGRLSDISWLMRQLAEHVAVRGGKQTGTPKLGLLHFWIFATIVADLTQFLMQQEMIGWPDKPVVNTSTPTKFRLCMPFNAV